MTPFEIIESRDTVVAIILPAEISTDRVQTLYKLLPPRARLDLELRRRWNVWAVMADPAWAEEQKKRVPMLPPHGRKLAFLD